MLHKRGGDGLTYAVSASLQAAVYAGLQGISVPVFDVAPGGVLPTTYAVLGTEDVRDRSDGTGGGALHDLVVSVHSDSAGFSAGKDVAAEICDALVGADFTLTRGRLVSMHFLKARARQGATPGARRIDLRFRARVDDI